MSENCYTNSKIVIQIQKLLAHKVQAVQLWNRACEANRQSVEKYSLLAQNKGYAWLSWTFQLKRNGYCPNPRNTQIGQVPKYMWNSIKTIT